MRDLIGLFWRTCPIVFSRLAVCERVWILQSLAKSTGLTIIVYHTHHILIIFLWKSHILPTNANSINIRFRQSRAERHDLSSHTKPCLNEKNINQTRSHWMSFTLSCCTNQSQFPCRPAFYQINSRDNVISEWPKHHFLYFAQQNANSALYLTLYYILSFCLHNKFETLIYFSEWHDMLTPKPSMMHVKEHQNT